MIMIGKLRRIRRDFTGQMNKNHISAYASSAAFFTFLSLIPMLMLLFALLPYTPLTEATLMKLLTEYLPENMGPLAVSVVTEMYDKSGTFLSLTILATVWSSAKGTLALIRGLNVINNVEERRNYIFLRLRACIYTVILLLMILVLLLIVVFGERIVLLLTGVVPEIRYLFHLLMNMRWIFVIVIMTLLFAAVYTWLPNKKNQFRKELPGALMVSSVWYIASWAFSIYVNNFSGFSTYGSLTTVIVIMIWLYMCFYIMLIGALLNRFFRPAIKYLYGVYKAKRENRKKTIK